MSDRNGIVRDRITRARARAGRTAIDVGTCIRVTGTSVNTANAQLTETTTTVYTGPARLVRQLARDLVVGEAERPTLRVTLELPYAQTNSGDLRQGDRFTFSASADAALVGKAVTVIGPEHGTTTSVRRYLVEEVAA